MKILRYAVIFACFLPLLILRDFTPNNELKYLSIADEALRDGHFFTFWNHGSIYADKPPLYLWIVMLGKMLTGEHCMFFLGLFSLVPALLILYIMDRWTQQELSETPRLSAQLMLMTSGLFTGAAIVLRMDMLMCLFIVLALRSFHSMYTGESRKSDKYLLPVYIFLAIFTKGPVGLLVPLISIPVFLIIKGKIRDLGKYLGWRQWVILSGLCLMWFTATYLEGGKTYLDNLLFHQTINRAVNAFHHKAPVWFYLKTIWYSLAPWILFYMMVLIMGARKHLFDSDLKKLFLVIILTTFITLSMFSSKLDIYLLPTFPFITFLSFLLLPGITSHYTAYTTGIIASILTLTFPALLLLTHYPELSILSDPFIRTAALLLSVSALVSLVFLFRKELTRSANSISIGILLTILIGSFSLPALNKYIGWREITQKAEKIATEKEIKNYYFYQLRSGENMDSYLKKEIHQLKIGEVVELSSKQNFILFVKNRDVKKDSDLQKIMNHRKVYKIGDYSFILFYIN